MSIITCVRLARAAAGHAAAALVVAAASAVPRVASAQLTLDAARVAARSASPELSAAREAVIAAAARERQAAVFQNPTLSYGREQTSRSGQVNAQNVLQVEQPFELGGQRAARRDAARFRRQSADARLAAAGAQLDLEVVHAWTAAVAADLRARLAGQAAAAFVEAQRVSDQRLAAGDVSGYVARRLRLEAARVAAMRASAELERQAARTLLATLMGRAPATGDSVALPDQLPAAAAGAAPAASLDSLLTQASRQRPELRAAAADAAGVGADARLAARERIPVAVLSAGYKGERVADPTLGSLTGFRGLVAGVSLPLTILDRRTGAINAAEADARRATADGESVRRRVAREVAGAHDALRAAEAQHALLTPHVGVESRAAVRAVQAAYAEGEITLTEWLDAIRAYHEAESTYITLQAEVLVRRAALARAVGTPLFPSAGPDR